MGLAHVLDEKPCGELEGRAVFSVFAGCPWLVVLAMPGHAGERACNQLLIRTRLLVPVLLLLRILLLLLLLLLLLHWGYL